MQRVMDMHRDAAYGIDRDDCPDYLLARCLRRGPGTRRFELGEELMATATRRSRCWRPPAPSGC